MVRTEDLESRHHFIFQKMRSAAFAGLLGLPDRNRGRGVEVVKHGLRFVLVLRGFGDVYVGLVLKNQT